MSLESVSSEGLSETRKKYALHKFSNEQIDFGRRREEAQFGEISSTSPLGARNNHPLNSPTLRQIESSTEQNVVIKIFIKTCERWRLDEEQQWILLGYRAEGDVRRSIFFGNFNVLSRDVEDRAGYVIGISLGLSALFQDKLEAELSWLNEPRAKLSSKSAIDYMLEGGMVNLIVVSEMIKRERGI